MIQCPFAITLTPPGGEAIELLPAGGWLVSLPVFSASQELFESSGAKLRNAFFRPLGNVVVSIELACERDHTSLVEALETFLDADAAGDVSLLQISGTLAFAAEGTEPIEFPDAVVSIINPDLPSGSTSTTVREISIKTSLPS